MRSSHAVGWRSPVVRLERGRSCREDEMAERETPDPTVEAALAGAEEAAAREAAAEAAAGREAAGAADGPKVVAARARTSGRGSAKTSASKPNAEIGRAHV